MNNYELLGVIGQGQYGTAYKARNRLDNQLYCIKKIAMNVSKDDQGAALKEAQLLSSLDHPNIIGYKESFLDKDNSLCIATTFCEEGDLFNKIRKRQQNNDYFSETEIMDMFIQTASALMYIHSRKVLHRDLKTQNIFVAKGGIIRLGDFGISRVLETTNSFATTVTGTPYYMAPEICTNQPYTFKSDIWSLGCVLYELCTLKHAFAADSLLSLVYQIVRGNFPPIPQNMFSQGMSNLVNALLIREPAQRPSLHEVFQMPYVVQNKQRYVASLENGGPVISRQTSNKDRRKQLLEKSTMDHRLDDPMGMTSEAALTPKERLARKKDAERRKRELELQIASLNVGHARKEVESRKQNMIYSSSIGIAGGAGERTGGSDAYMRTYNNPMEEPTLPRGGGRANGMWDVDPGKPAPAPETPWQQGQARGLTTAGEFGYGLDNSIVNLNTMPKNAANNSVRGGYFPPPAPDAGSTIRSSLHWNAPPSKHTPTSADNHAMEDDDAVLYGSVRHGTSTMHSTVSRTINAATTQLRQQAQRPGTVAGYRGGYDAALSSPRPMTAGDYGGGSTIAAPSRASVGAVPAAAQRNLVASPVTSQGGFRFPGQETASSTTFTPRVGQGRGTSPYAPIRHVTPPRTHHHVEENYDDDDFENYDDEDFEEYEEQEQVSKQRALVMKNVKDMERSDDQDDEEIAKVQETMSTMTKNSKTAALRQKCLDDLGTVGFKRVYTYLMNVRSSSADATDEREIRRRLLDLLEGDNRKLASCFMVDQLVFQESLYR